MGVIMVYKPTYNWGGRILYLGLKFLVSGYLFPQINRFWPTPKYIRGRVTMYEETKS